MQRFFRSCITAMIAVFCLLSMVMPGIRAEETGLAQDISGKELVVESSPFISRERLFDKQFRYYTKGTGLSYLKLSHEQGLGSLYFMFTRYFGTFTVTNEDTGEKVFCGTNRFIREFVDLVSLFGTAPKTVTVAFDAENVCIQELYVFTEGQVPGFVEQWQAPVEGKTDLLLFSTHADDEHLFFAGVLPYYAGERDYQVQTVYLTDHHNSHGEVRNREALAGLWTVGVDTYPVFGEFADLYAVSKWEAYERLAAAGYTRDEMLSFVVEQIRRFKPKVVVTHDFAGEYGHGQHMIYAELVAEAVRISMDPEMFPESADIYGVWDVPKTYIHLLTDNQIFMNWDKPLESFGGKTAFEMSIYHGFQCHESQVEDFRYYYNGYTKARDLPKWNPCYYGLYRSTVGADLKKNDFFENLLSYEEEAVELERQRAEEEARLKEEQEEAIRQQEQQRLQAEEAARLLEARQREALAREAAQQRNHVAILAAVSVLILSLIAVIFRIKNGRK